MSAFKEINPKEIVERRHAAQHSMALGVTEEKY